jgi:hypothetical protein
VRCPGHRRLLRGPSFKEVPNLADVGYRIAKVETSGEALISKTPNSGGFVSMATCEEQLLYELHDPARYLTPDVTADVTGICLRQWEKDVVEVTGGSGTARPDTLKVTVGYRAGWIGEAEVMGIDSLYPGSAPVAARGDGAPPYEARVRVAARVRTAEEAEMVVHEVDSLGLNGPSGGSIAAHGVREVLGVVSTFVPRDLIRPSVTSETVRA